MKTVLLLALSLFCLGARAESDLKIESRPKALPETDPGVQQDTLYHLQNIENDARQPVGSLLTVGARIDVSFSGGSPVYQGFSVPSLRLNAFGSAGNHVEYGLSLGQTREFSSALLPQMLPVDAYVTLKANSGEYGTIRCTMGMFNPTQNPWWSPDLATVALPDYHVIHRSVLLDNDLGLELSYQPMDGMVKLTFGVFNGNGIFSLNTNNSKAFAGSVSLNGDWGDSKLQIGMGTHSLEQSTIGSVNFRSNWTVDLFASIESGPLYVGIDSFLAGVEDSVKTLNPRGSAAFVHYTVWEKVGIFGRVEGMDQAPANGGSLTVWQLGPKLLLDKHFQGYFYYESYRMTGSSAISSGQLRLRVAI